MSLGEDVLAPAHLGTTSIAMRASTAALARLPVYAACTVLALLANYVIGGDMAWDTVNYHFYSGFSAVNDRFAQDYFAAGAQSYFNPYAYVPFYALVRAGLSPLEISSALAVVHSVILWLTFELAVCVCPSDDNRLRIAYGVSAIALTFFNPILVQEIGSSYADITTAELALAAWLLLARAVRAPRTALVVWAGLLLGLAVGLKATNAVHALAGFALLLMLPESLLGRIRYGFGYAIALGLGFVLVSAPWSYRLEQMFGNPVFPLMNGIFRSPEFTTEPLRLFRFIPESFVRALWRPFAIVDPVPMVQEELTAPDLRYAVLVILVIILLIQGFRRLPERPSISSAHSKSDLTARVSAALGCGLVVDWGMWLSASGNGRYFLPMASVAAVMIVALTFRLFEMRPKTRNYILAIIFGAQVVQLCFGANYRWDAVPWRRQWLEVQVPQKLATEPTLYLTIGAQSNAFIAPYLAKGSGLINFSGGYALGPGGATGTRIDGLIRRYTPHVRVLLRTVHQEADDQEHERFTSHANDSLSRLGLRVDTTDCLMITVNGLPRETEIRFTSSNVPETTEHSPNDTSYLTTCHVRSDDADHSAQIARQRAVDLVFDRIEDACPKLFQPRRALTEHDGDVWRRLYLNTDLMASVSHGSVKFLNLGGGFHMADLGPERKWAKAPLRLDCGRRDGQYFAQVSESWDGA